MPMPCRHAFATPFDAAGVFRHYAFADTADIIATPRHAMLFCLITQRCRRDGTVASAFFDVFDVFSDADCRY